MKEFKGRTPRSQFRLRMESCLRAILIEDTFSQRLRKFIANQRFA
jgi:hypothetical protein